MQRSKVGVCALAAGVLLSTVIALAVNMRNAPRTYHPNFGLGVSYPDSPLSDNWYDAAPYVLPTEQDPPDLAQVMAATGQRAFTLGSVRAPTSGGCRATWGGNTPVSADTVVRDMVNTVRNRGGDVVLSFGGYGGTKLGQVCGSAEATADAYQEAINRYAAKAVDFDIEAPGLSGPTAVANVLGAARLLQQRNAGLHVSITTAGAPSGTGWFGQQVLNLAKGIGFAPDNYSISTVDGGFTNSATLIGALEAFHGMLMNTFGWDAATAYAREGFAGVNGESQASEFFDQTYFHTVLDYAIGHRLSRYTFMSVNRDRPCGGPDGIGACSNVPQSPWEFTRFTARFGTATEPTALPGPPATSAAEAATTETTTETTTVAPPSPAPPPPPTTTAPRKPPAGHGNPPDAPGPTAPPVLRHAGISYEAEWGRMSGGAVVYSCTPCSGYNKVGQLGAGAGAVVLDNVTVGEAGGYALTISYLDGDNGRSALVTVDGRSTWLNFPGTGDGDWNRPRTLTITVSLNAGQNTIAFSNPYRVAPEIDRVTL